MLTDIQIAQNAKMEHIGKIAEKLGLPLGTVKSRIFFARQRLQNILKDYR